MSKKFWSYVQLLALNFIVLLLVFQQVVFAPFDHMLSYKGDGYKNLYTTSYFVRYDSGSQFSGMGYPFTDHMVYGDVQPAVAYMLHWWHHNIGSLDGHFVGIHNILLMLSIFPAAILIYMLLRRVNLPQNYSIVLATIITWFSPQMYRITGHFGLSYEFIIPAIWLLLLNIQTNHRRYLSYFLLGALLLFSGMMHLYHVPMALFFIFAYVFVHYLQERKEWKQHWRWYVCAVLCAVIPLIILRVWVSATDPVLSDRIPVPDGYLYYRASFDSVFLPPDNPLKGFWNVFFETRPAFEGYGYVGVVGLAVLIFSLVKIVKYARKREWVKIFKPALPFPLQTALWAAVIILLMAMAFPFKWKLGFLLEYIPLKQFRSVGRFAWVFYYVFMVYAALYFYMLFRRMRRLHKNIAYSIMVIFFFLLTTETFIQIRIATGQIRKLNDNYLETKKYTYAETLKAAGYKVDDFQAILPIPYFLEGNDKTGMHSEKNYEAMMLSYREHIPMAAVMLARYPAQQSVLLKQILASEEITKEVIALYPNRKPLLVCKTDRLPTSFADERLLRKAKYLGSSGGQSFYYLSLDSLEKNPYDYNYCVRAMGDSSMTRHGELYYASNAEEVLRKHWNDPVGMRDLPFSPGAYKTKEEEEKILDHIPLNASRDSMVYEYSVWMYLDFSNSYITEIKVTQYDANGKEVHFAKESLASSHDLYDRWVRLSLRDTLYSKTNTVTVVINDKDVIIDELLIRPVHLDVYYNRTDVDIRRNNYKVEKK